MAQVLDSPLSSPLSSRSVLSVNLADHRLQLQGDRGYGGGAIEGDPFAFHESEDDTHDDDDDVNYAVDSREQPENDMKSLLLVDISSQLSYASQSMAASQEILTQNADLTQMTQDANESCLSLSPIHPKSPAAPLPWGRLMPLYGETKIDLLPRPPQEKPSCGGPRYSMMGMDQLKPSDIFNIYTLGRSHKCEVMVQKPNKDSSQDEKELRLFQWAYGMVSNRHCTIFCTLPEDPKTADIPGSSSLPASSMEVWLEDSSNNGTMINGSILLQRGQKRRLHSGDEIAFVNSETLRKKVRDNATIQKIQQQHSYVFVNLTHQQQQQPESSKSKQVPVPINIFPSQATTNGFQLTSSAKRRTGLVNVRAMNYTSSNRCPLPKANGAYRSPAQSSPCYGLVQPTPKCFNIWAGGNQSNGRYIAAATSTPTTTQPVSSPPRRIEQDYDIRDLLGRGTSGEVRRAIHRQTGKERAVKIVSLPPPGLLSSRNQQETQQWKKEAEILRGLKHPYIVELVDVYCTEAHLYLVMELCKGGDLFDGIVDKGSYTEENSRKVMRRLLSAVHYIHEDCQLVHRDLKPENILLTSAIEPKIADFGVAKSASSDLKTFCGTPSYIAPEVLRRRHTELGRGRYGKSADVWSIGVILYIMLSGTPPYDIDGAAGMDAILQASLQIQFPDKYWSCISSNAKDLVLKMLQKDPCNRITVQEAMEHPWVLIEDGDTHRHPLEDPKLLGVTQKRLFSPVQKIAERKQAKKKRRVSMDSVFETSPSSTSCLAAVLQRPLSPVENRGASTPLSPPPSPPLQTKKVIVAKCDNVNDENRFGPVETESLNQMQPPRPVSNAKEKRKSKEVTKKGFVRAAELDDDKICSQFTDEEESISSFGIAMAVTVAKSDGERLNATGAGTVNATFDAKQADSKQPGEQVKSRKKESKVVMSKVAKVGKSKANSSKSSGGTESKTSQASTGTSKQATLARWFQPVKKFDAN